MKLQPKIDPPEEGEKGSHLKYSIFVFLFYSACP